MRLHQVTAAASAALLGSVALTAAGPASASSTASTAGTAGTASTAVCAMSVGSITQYGDIAHAAITASAPPVAKQSTGPHMFVPGIARVSGTWTTALEVPAGSTTTGNVVLNETLYSASYSDASGVPPTSLKKIGPGWGGYTATDVSFWQKSPGSTVIKSARYGLHPGAGSLHRWADGHQGEFVYGFGSVKAMALISETATYDTFLANTNGGALYTVRIPRTRPMKTIVTKVRPSTWGAFDALVVEKCGSQSSLLTAIDRDTGTAYLYAVGHAKGAATVIKSLGKLPGKYQDAMYFLNTTEGQSPLFGE
jgi:hypothetical protein